MIENSMCAPDLFSLAEKRMYLGAARPFTAQKSHRPWKMTTNSALHWFLVFLICTIAAFPHDTSSGYR